MKKIILNLGLLLFCLPLFVNAANPQADEKAKLALKVIQIGFLCWNSDNVDFLKPQKYTTDSLSGVINGQNFIFPLKDRKYSKVVLNWSGTTIPDAVFYEGTEKRKVILNWEGDKVVGIKIDALYNFEFIVNYTADGKLKDLTRSTLIAGKYKGIRALEITDDQVTKITYYENEGSKVWYRNERTFVYNGKETTVKVESYPTGKANKPDNIYRTYTAVYKKIDDNTLEVISGDEAITSKYNAQNFVTEKKTVKNGKTELINYTYKGEVLCKTETINSTAQGFVDRTVFIMETLTDQPTSAPYYEKNQGVYKFDKDGALIYETKNNPRQWREKVNGVWSEWKDFRM